MTVAHCGLVGEGIKEVCEYVRVDFCNGLCESIRSSDAVTVMILFLCCVFVTWIRYGGFEFELF